ncbi:MAG: GDP-mannose 4,6-dehydratase [Candidatus Omnitrophica bacterium]|nr:GDP-mannose 4,6-dehydratase [Candidatus Omnitrophota bacterium]
MNDTRKFKKIFIAGITGAAGSYLADYIVARHPNVCVHGLARGQSKAARRNLAGVESRVEIHYADLTDLHAVLEVLYLVRPDGIVHVASDADVRASFKAPLPVLYNNMMGAAHLLDAVRQLKLDPYILICSSSEVYGRVDPRHIPVNETCPLQGVNPYSVSKVTQDLLGECYFLCYGMKIIRARMFPYISPRRPDLFASAFATQVARIEAGLQTELTHGNLDAKRTLLDARDAAEALWIALTQGRPGEVYNIGAKNPVTIREFLEILKQKARRPIPSRVDPGLLRPTDIALSIPDTAKFETETGWQPKYAFADTVDHLLDYCRKQVEREKKK